MTWSARSRSVCGIVRPRAFAVLRLITNSKLGGLLYWQVRRLGAFQYPVDEICGTTHHVGEVGAVRHETARLDKVPDPIDPRHLMLEGETGKLDPMRVSESAEWSDDAPHAVLLGPGEGKIPIIGTLDLDEQQGDADLLRSSLQFTAYFDGRRIGAGDGNGKP
jgi:hypothetical protein